MKMNWDDLAGGSDDDADEFFESRSRVSSVTPLDVFSDDDDDEFEDSRTSFTVHPYRKPSSLSAATPAHPTAADHQPSMENYLVWMAAPGSVKERRKRLFQGMGINSNLSRLFTLRFSRKFCENRPPSPPRPPSIAPENTVTDNASSPATSDEQSGGGSGGGTAASSSTASPAKSSAEIVLFRSRSDGDMEFDSFHTKRRREEMIGRNVSKQRLTRTSSSLVPFARMCRVNVNPIRMPRKNNGGGDRSESGGNLRIDRDGGSGPSRAPSTGHHLGAFFLIKNLDTGNEFIVKEFDQDGMWNRLSDLQTGKQLTMEEFEKSVGYSPVVKELMRRQNVGREGHGGIDRKKSVTSKSFRYSKKRGASFLKNIRSSVTYGSSAEKEMAIPPPPKRIASSEWVKVRQQGKTHKELTALRLCQEIQAHEGSIWTMKFNADGKFLASAGEDKVIHVWEVQEREISSRMSQEEGACGDLIACASTDRNLAFDKKGKLAGKRLGVVPDYVQLPETLFMLSEKPFCSFTGHLDDVLDVSWSTSQLRLLSSSIDKTVRLWDLETNTCLKVFAHNDYVTCIQFNPVDDNYFISGSLDAKLRLWSVPGQRVVDWVDVHEMVTAACYSPDGQSAIMGSHKGSCRMYRTADGKLTPLSQFNLPNKNRKPAKITGFEFTPDSPSEVLITSADSRIRIYDGQDMIHKFVGFQNTSSQIAASYSPCGTHIICASEDSNVFVWRREEPRHGSTNAAKSRTMVSTRSYEQFHSKDVTVAIPGPGSIKFDPPTVSLNPKKATNRSSQPTSSSGSPMAEASNKKQHLPPLPKKATNNKISGNGGAEETRRQEEAQPASPDSDGARIARKEPGASGESFNWSSSYSAAGWPSWSPGWLWSEGGSGNQGDDTMQATAWGLVIVTAGLGGEIRAYQNLGLPLRVGRQNLFS